ncbi:muscle M-line assembly protein unc-89 [Drosophila obscura]|uniref:muscle M-line assembly protein unc-89 n=1 Tax=Drosophila obscura TaxID=7282 RepID=UPI001BB2846F|nr:muscle M-line assembly protein unc-89 [Drosophila obscura]
MATSSLVQFPDLISTKNRTESLGLPDVKRINNITKFMADPVNFDGDITKLAAHFENQAKQCQDVINLLNDQLKAKTTALHQVKEDMLELQRQLKQPDATFVYVIMKTQVLVKFLDETEVNEYDVPSALERYNIKMSCLYGEILALDSDVDHVTYLKNVATVNAQYVKDWYKREMAKLEPEQTDPKDKQPEESFDGENDPEEESDEELWEHESEPEQKYSKEKEPELKDRDDEPEEKVIGQKDSQMKVPGERDSMKIKGKLPEKTVSKEKVIGKTFPEGMKPEKRVPGEKVNEQKSLKNIGPQDKDAKLPGKKVPSEKIPDEATEEKLSWEKKQTTNDTEDKSPNAEVISEMKVPGQHLNLKKDNEHEDAKEKLPEKMGFQKKVAGKNAPKELISKKLPEKNFSKQKVIGKDDSALQALKELPVRGDIKKLGNSTA